LWSTNLVTAPGRRNTPSCERAVDATEAKETTEPAGDKVDASGDVDEPSNIILSVSKNAGETEDTSVLTRVDVGDPSDEEVVDEFVVEPVIRIHGKSDTRKSKKSLAAYSAFDPSHLKLYVSKNTTQGASALLCV